MSTDATFIGVDIGGTHTKTALVDSNGLILLHQSLPTAASGDPSDYFKVLREILGELAEAARKQGHPVGGIGAALPGFLSEQRTSIVFNPNTAALVGVDFEAELQSLGLPLSFEQDLNVPALAEYYFGERRGARRLMTVSIGTGLGAAMTIDGKLLRYYGPVAGDNGHIILQPDGPACTAGCHGCAEALVSAPAIERAYLEEAEHPSAGSMREVIAAGASPARAVISAAVGGDPFAVKLISEMAAWLGQWLASLAATYLPEVIVICGGVSACGETLRQPAEQRMRQLTGPEYARCEVLVGKFLGYSGVIGAIIPFLMERSLD